MTDQVSILISVAFIVLTAALWIHSEIEDREYYKSEADRYRNMWLRSIGEEEDEL